MQAVYKAQFLLDEFSIYIWQLHYCRPQPAVFFRNHTGTTNYVTCSYIHLYTNTAIWEQSCCIGVCVYHLELYIYIQVRYQDQGKSMRCINAKMQRPWAIATPVNIIYSSLFNLITQHNNKWETSCFKFPHKPWPTCPLSGVLWLQPVDHKGKQLGGRVEAADLSEEGAHSLTNRLLGIANLWVAGGESLYQHNKLVFDAKWALFL